MKRIVLLSLLISGCYGGISVGVLDNTDNPGAWSFVKSPQTGKCYEVYRYTYVNTPSHKGYGFMGMSEVDESFCQ